MAAEAQRCHIRQNGLDGPWIIRMLRQGTVARLAVHGLMRATRFQGRFIGVASLADLVSGIRHGPRADLRQGVPTKWTVPAETPWGHRPLEHNKENQTEQEDSRQPDQMRRVFEFSHAGSPLQECRTTRGMSFARIVESRVAWCR